MNHFAKGFKNENIQNPFIVYMADRNSYSLGKNITPMGAAFYIAPFVRYGKYNVDLPVNYDYEGKEESIMVDGTVKAFSVTREGNLVTMKVEADGFLYNMVRIMVGTLLRIQQGKIPVDGIAGIIEKKDRKFAGPTAQPCGLYLNRVNYD